MTSPPPSTDAAFGRISRRRTRHSRCLVDRRTWPSASVHRPALLRAGSGSGARPSSYRGDMVFVAQAGRPIGGRFDAEASQDLRLNADVDEVRNDLIHDFMYSGGLEKLAFVSGVGAVTADQPRTLPGGGQLLHGRAARCLFLQHPAADVCRRGNSAVGTDPAAALGRSGKGRERCGQLIVQVALPVAIRRTLDAVRDGGCRPC